MKKGLLIVMSGPSGSGKSTINTLVREMNKNIVKSVSVTTRPPRTGEEDGVHYFFKTEDEYRQMIADGAFLETAAVYTNYYGTPKSRVFELLDKGFDVLLEIDTIGAMQVRRAHPESILIFIMPPSMTELERRLRERDTESDDAVRIRLRAAKREMSKVGAYDYVVENDTPLAAAQTLLDIVTAERCAVRRNAQEIANILNN
ncbi:MAG: guanylate kinase [Firmicutes bacterium]|nr:guanylate kinase [Bacillota bacterium]